MEAVWNASSQALLATTEDGATVTSYSAGSAASVG
ncbi:hypothetical protein ABIA96_000713 [Bradyrhizobium sp. LB11.1]|jgi:hypothetical protein